MPVRPRCYWKAPDAAALQRWRSQFHLALPGKDIEEGLLPVLPRLTQRHTVLVASVADPYIAKM
ncbi:hypothetical protein, partial [Streptomyces spectabilis]|uniref:hypothetical protein n=1 Tax=Streptomyces spectabilis TaxID=68270 RepID=UPI0033C8C8E2